MRRGAGKPARADGPDSGDDAADDHDPIGAGRDGYEATGVLRGVPATEVYEAAVTVLMRLVFLLFAEERRLLPAEDPLWAESYSVLTLRDDLRTVRARLGEPGAIGRAASIAWDMIAAARGGAR